MSINLMKLDTMKKKWAAEARYKAFVAEQTALICQGCANEGNCPFVSCFNRQKEEVLKAWSLEDFIK